MVSLLCGLGSAALAVLGPAHRCPAAADDKAGLHGLTLDVGDDACVGGDRSECCDPIAVLWELADCRYAGGARSVRMRLRSSHSHAGSRAASLRPSMISLQGVRRPRAGLRWSCFCCGDCVCRSVPGAVLRNFLWVDRRVT